MPVSFVWFCSEALRAVSRSFCIEMMIGSWVVVESDREERESGECLCERLGLGESEVSSRWFDRGIELQTHKGFG